MKSPTTLLAVFAFAALPLNASAAIIIDNTTTGALYNQGLGDLHAMDGVGGFLVGPNSSEGDPTIVLGADPNFAFTPQFGNDWLGGDYTGGSWLLLLGPVPSSWALNTETAIVYDFNLATASNIHIDLGVDNGIVLWLDGNFLFGATAPGGSALTEYDVDIAALAAGAHRLQILRADHGGAQDFDISVDATAVPEPGTLLLSIVSLAGMGLARRKKALRR